MACIKIGDWIFDDDCHSLSQGSQRQVIEPQLSQFLSYLISNADRVLSRDELVEHAWVGIVSDAAINQAVAKLRKLLKDDAKQPVYIETIAKKGYRLVAEIEVIEEQKETPEVIPRSSSKMLKLTHRSFMLAFSMTLLISLTLVYYVISSFMLESTPLMQVANTKPITSLVGKEVHPAPHGEGNHLVYSSKKTANERFDLFLSDMQGNVLKRLTNTMEASELRASWSPDGEKLAYVQHSAGGCEVRLINNVLATIDQETTPSSEKLTDCSPFDTQLQWSADGRKVLFNRQAYAHGPYRIYSIDTVTGRMNELTQANEGITGDIAFKVSPDGNQMAVLRTHHWNQSTLMLVNMGSGLEQKLRSLPYWVRSLSWDASGEHLVFAAAPFYHELQRYNIKHDRLDVILKREHIIEDVTFHPQNQQLMYSQHNFNADITVVDNPRFHDAMNERELIASSRNDWQPVASPDGSRLAFMSDRSGNVEIWVRELGSNIEKQLSRFEGETLPYRMQWSSESDALVFDAKDERLYVLDVKTGNIRAITSSEKKSRNPRWTDTGIYYTAREHGEWQIWHKQTPDTEAIQVNENNVFAAEPIDSGMGAGLLYTKFYLSGFWYKEHEQGTEKQLVDHGSQGPFNQWHQTHSGIYYLATSKTGALGVFFYSYEHSTSTLLFDIFSRELVGFSLSEDEQKIYVTRINQEQSDIVMAVP